MDIMKEPMETENDLDEDYSLDEIVERRVVNGEVKYFLKWKCNPTNDVKQTKRNLECPLIMDAFEKSPKEKKPSKNDTRDKKKTTQNCTSPSVVSDVSESEKKKVHSKTCKSYLHSKKVDTEDKAKERKQKHTAPEECVHLESKAKDEKAVTTKPMQHESTDASENSLKMTNKLATTNLEESVSAGKDKNKNL